jgi:type IV pilus assembly protein PilM
MPFGIGSRGAVGLDIGASAVRVAQLGGTREAPSLTNFGQVALPQGAVVDGEIRDPGPVSEAIAQLWKRTKLRSKDAILGIANQRVVVRQVDLPYLDETEFRAALPFQAADYIPMPVEEAQLDFILLSDYVTDNNEHMMRVLLIAAATDMVEGFVDCVTAAGIMPAGVDLTPFAVARAISPVARGESGVGGSEAIIDVGAGITNIVVHHNGEPRFVRILLVGGDDATTSIAELQDVPFEEAEAMKFDAASDVGGPEVLRILRTQVDALVEEIRGSLDYYLSQEDSEPIVSILVTGGGSLTPGLMKRMEEAFRTPIVQATPLAELNASKSGLTEEQVAQIQPVAAAAIGLALGGMAK